MFTVMMVLVVLIALAMLVYNYMAIKKMNLSIDKSFAHLESKSIGLMDKINSYSQSMIETIFYISHTGQADIKLNLDLAVKLLNYHMKVAISKAYSLYPKKDAKQLSNDQAFIETVVGQIMIQKDLINTVLFMLKVCTEHSAKTSIALCQERIDNDERGVSEKWTFNRQTDIEFLTRTFKRYLRKWIQVSLSANNNISVYIQINAEIFFDIVRKGGFDKLLPVQYFDKVSVTNEINDTSTNEETSIFYTFTIFEDEVLTFERFKRLHNSSLYVKGGEHDSKIS